MNNTCYSLNTNPGCNKVDGNSFDCIECRENYFLYIDANNTARMCCMNDNT